MNDFNLTFDVEDLALDDLAVTVMRDAVGLPESGASQGSGSCGSSCCCVSPPVPDPSF
ncbi:thiazolylpeptide-type bacteriocin [Saccharothrix sp. NRRL B-16348]|uniref:thiazolylpeptide-type bacteriocin n=1 Tax=Saccharothrix sp. NRRL B-16348 TaxID=1415542 RepID=UPI001E5EC5D8|nr:thiazolylpeptide-type bacteriocin [Saccharothrix sp. NRRL B-16348]